MVGCSRWLRRGLGRECAAFTTFIVVAGCSLSALAGFDLCCSESLWRGAQNSS
ncbi:hypothetical protein OH77DRAFT_824282 [Trametes cingulata]|nr:hypothetical protein OH77DRAFT_824282 [Trametes cingulata]